VGSELRQVLLGWMPAQLFSLPHSVSRGAGKNSSVEAERVMPLYKQEKGVALMTMTTENETTLVNEETLARHWKERCASGQFSQACNQRRTVLATASLQASVLPTPRAVAVFDPSVETLLVTSMIRGG
jgi:hypothetical protein